MGGAANKPLFVESNPAGLDGIQKVGFVSS